MINKIAIQTDTQKGYVTEILSYEKDGAYRYCEELRDAVMFLSITAAVRWIERTSFQNGERNTSYSGSPQLVRVEVEQLDTYRAVGLVE